MATTYSSLHQAKQVHFPPPTKSKTRPPPRSVPPPPLSAPLSSMPTADPLSLATSRTSSLAGRKRPRDSDSGDAVKIIPRRTKSVGGPSGSEDGKSKDREAFQRGLINVFVPKALAESARGIMNNYNDLLASFLPTPLVPTPILGPLLPLIRSLTANVNLLSPGLHGRLVTAILALPWVAAEERFVKAYIGWAGVLISAHPDWTKEVLKMAVQGLTWRYPLKVSSTPSPIARRTAYTRYHLLITHLLALIPTLPSLLAPLLMDRFPNKRDREVAQITYLRNMCEVSDYCPELNGRIWDQIIDRLLRIDVEITRAADAEEDEDEEEEEEDEKLAELCAPSELKGDPWELTVVEDIPPDPVIRDRQEADDEDDDGIDVDDLSSDGEGSDDGEGPSDPVKDSIARAKKKLHLILMRRKLDGMLVYFFRHLEESMGYRSASPPAFEFAASTITAASSGRSTPTTETPLATPSLPTASRRTRTSPAQSLAFFQTLLNLFSRQILPTSATQHIPFLLFICSSFSLAHTDLFLGLLVSHSLYGVTTPTAASISQPVSLNQRVAATVYIGSVVCRARYVNDDKARQVMTYLLAYMEGKMQQSKMMSKVDDLPLFYSVCQAAMLIFCFRWRAFLATERDDEVVGDMELEGDEGGVTAEGKWMRELDVLQRALTSELNPLLGCNPTIVQTFAKVAHQTNFAYCFSILESNASAARSASSHSLNTLARAPPTTFNRSLSTPTASFSSTPMSSQMNKPTRTPSSSANAVNGANQSVPRIARQVNIDAGLDNYFPFDPYDLPRSGGTVEKLYRTWGEVAVKADGDSDDDSDEEESEEEDDDEDDDDDDDEEEDGLSELDADSPLSDHLSPRMTPRLNGAKRVKKNNLGTSADRRKMLSRSGGELSSSFDGMSISPRISGVLSGSGK